MQTGKEDGAKAMRMKESLYTCFSNRAVTRVNLHTMLHFLEHGRYLALDLGGTNFRVLLVNLKGRQTPEVVSKLFLIPTRIMVGSGQQASQMCIHNLRVL
jgi:Hexokinase